MELNRTATSPARDETYLLAEQLYNLCRGHKLGEIRAAVERLQWWIGEEAIIPIAGGPALGQPGAGRKKAPRRGRGGRGYGRKATAVGQKTVGMLYPIHRLAAATGGSGHPF